MLLRGLLLFCLPWSLHGCRPAGPISLEPLRVALPALEQNALIYIAEHQGFFTQNGLEVTIQDFDTGIGTLKALRQNEVDLAVAAEYPVVRALLTGDPLAVLACIDKFENDFVVARKDRGINRIADLKGKRIGVTLQTVNEFHLARFLEQNGLGADEITRVDLQPAQFVDALAGGQIDALIAWQPYIYQVEQVVPDVIVWPAQNNQFVSGLLVAGQTWLAENQHMVVRFLNALLQAESFLAHHPQDAREIVQERLAYGESYVSQVWDNHDFALTLDNSLIVVMNDQARWLIRSGLSTQTQAPDFYQAIYLDGLNAIKPEAVTFEQ